MNIIRNKKSNLFNILHTKNLQPLNQYNQNYITNNIQKLTLHPFYTYKGVQQSLSEKQKQKQLSQKLKKEQESASFQENYDQLQHKINKLDQNQQENTNQYIINRHEEPPRFSNVGLFCGTIPFCYYYFNTAFTQYFTADYTNSLCMMMDWTGLLMAGFTGGFYFYSLFKTQRPNDHFERKPYFKTIVFLNLASISTSLYLINTLNIFAVMPMFVGALVSMPFIYQTGDINSVHKNYITQYFKFTLFLSIATLLTVIGQMSFQNYKHSMEDSLQQFSTRSLREYEEEQEKIQLEKEKQQQEQQQQNNSRQKKKWF